MAMSFSIDRSEYEEQRRLGRPRRESNKVNDVLSEWGMELKEAKVPVLKKK